MNRTKVLSGIVLAGVLAVAGRAVVAQQPAASGPNVAGIEKVKDNLWMVTGGGGNTAVFVTANGVVLVDTKLANWGQAIMDKVKTVTDKPVTHIINTHTHGDHVGSNEYFPASVEIVAHANVSTSMAKMPAFADGTKKHAFPDRTYTDKLTVLSGNDAIDLYYFGPAHTNGDTFVVFRNLRVMHTGDAFSAKGAPLIDVNNGGSGVTYPDTIAKAIAGVKNVETVIPGHSTVMTWQDFVEFGEFTTRVPATVQAAKKRRQDRRPGRRRAGPARQVQGLRDDPRQGQRGDDLQAAALMPRALVMAALIVAAAACSTPPEPAPPGGRRRAGGRGRSPAPERGRPARRPHAAQGRPGADERRRALRGGPRPARAGTASGSATPSAPSCRPRWPPASR